MKTNAVIRIVIFSLLILILLGILLGVLCFNLFLVDGRVQIDNEVLTPEPTSGQITQESYTSDIRNIEIDWVAGNIEITASPLITELSVAEKMGNDVEYRMVCKQSGQTLKIAFSKDQEKFHLIGNNSSVQKDLHIRVPADWICNSLEIDAAATDVTITDLRIIDLDFDSASGVLNLDNCDIDILDIDTASGDVVFNGMLNELDFDAASASFDGEFYSIPQRLNLDAMSGDMTLVLPEHSRFTCTLGTMSGSFDSDFDFEITASSQYTCGDGSCKINLSGLSGNVSILKGISQPKNCDH